MPDRYKSRNVEIEAAHWNGRQSKAYEIIEWIYENGGTANFRCGQQCCENELGIMVQTLEGKMKAQPQDYIIKGLVGEFYPCKPDVFERKYERMSEGHI